MLVWSRLASAARTADTLSGSSTTIAMMMPTMARGAPAAATAASIAGERIFASPTTTTSEIMSSAKLSQVSRFDGGGACTASLPVSLAGRK